MFPLVWGVLLSVQFTKLISSGAKLSALGYGADIQQIRRQGKVNRQCRREGGEDVDKVYVIKIAKLKVDNVHNGQTRAFFIIKK